MYVQNWEKEGCCSGKSAIAQRRVHSSVERVVAGSTFSPFLITKEQLSSSPTVPKRPSTISNQTNIEPYFCPCSRQVYSIIVTVYSTLLSAYKPSAFLVISCLLLLLLVGRPEHETEPVASECFTSTGQIVALQLIRVPGNKSVDWVNCFSLNNCRSPKGRVVRQLPLISSTISGI